MSRDGAAGRIFKRAAGISLALLLTAGVAGYVAFWKHTPVSLQDAVDRFHAGNDDSTSGRYEVTPTRERRMGKEQTRADHMNAIDARSVAGKPSLATHGAADIVAAVAREMAAHFDVMPAEGVYTYIGRGQESIDPVPPRDFRRVTHRIITHDDHDTWTEHHIFSEERASWTKITTSETGRLVHHQRNFIKIGPYEEDKIFPFYPPIQAVRFPHRVGERWDGRFTGETNDGESYTGTYRVEAVDDSIWKIGGTRVRVFGFEFFAELVGEFNGTVTVKYWFAPRYGVTVREEYYADATVGVLKYWGEWFVKLRSLTPRT